MPNLTVALDPSTQSLTALGARGVPLTVLIDGQGRIVARYEGRTEWDTPEMVERMRPWTHRVFSNLKTWALGVYHGLRRPHAQAYLDEFVFRFNRRLTRHAAFRTLLGIGVIITPATYKMLISPEARG